MKSWLQKQKKKLQKWLGIESLQKKSLLTNQRIDLIYPKMREQIEHLTELYGNFDYEGQSKIVILSTINGGVCKIVDVQFTNDKEVQRFIKEVANKYGCRQKMNAVNKLK